MNDTETLREPKTTKVQFSNPNMVNLGKHIHSAAGMVKDGTCQMVSKDRHRSEPGVVLCSTGPSIQNKKVLKQIKGYLKQGYRLAALKESIPFIKEKTGVLAKYSVAMDPGGDRQVTRTPAIPGVTYCLASSCNPILYNHLLAAGCEVEVFHSACGYQEPCFAPGIEIKMKITDDKCIILGEHDLQLENGCHFSPVIPGWISEVGVYQHNFPTADCMQGGFAVTNRALALMKYMGFPEVVMAGTDFGWRKKTKNGSHYAKFVSVKPEDPGFMDDEGRIDGDTWCTRPDQLASAVDVAWKIKNGEITVLGDSLAVALAKKDDEFLEDIVQIC